MSVSKLKTPSPSSQKLSKKTVSSSVVEAVKASGLGPVQPEPEAFSPESFSSSSPESSSLTSSEPKTDPVQPTPLYPDVTPESSSGVTQTVFDAPAGNVEDDLKPRITVVGVGGAGCNAVNNMISSSLQGVQFVVCNTDAQALSHSLTDRRIQLGHQITQGLGAGSKPEVGHAAAEESLQDIIKEISGSNMVFITAGMGGGTGTGAAPVVAQAARELGILTVAVATKPFHFEGNHRMKTAEQGIEELAQYVDTLIVIPNQNLFRIATEKTGFMEAFKLADNVLHSGVRGVTDLMMMPGLINLDFADIRSVMSEMGKAMMGTGEASGEGRSIAAAEAAISNPLLDDVSMKGARGVLINITGGMDMTLFEVDEAANRIRDEVDPDANIIFGSTFDERLEGVMRVSVVATGIEAEESRRRLARYQQEKESQQEKFAETPESLGDVALETYGQTETSMPPATPSSGTNTDPSYGDGDVLADQEAVPLSDQNRYEDSVFGPQGQERQDPPKKKGFFSRFASTLRRGKSSEEEGVYHSVPEKNTYPGVHSDPERPQPSEQKTQRSSSTGPSYEEDSVQDVPAYLRRQNK